MYMKDGTPKILRSKNNMQNKKHTSLEYISYKDFIEGAKLSPEYYLPERWSYMSKVIASLKETIPDASTAIELGPHKFPIIKNADTIGLNRDHYRNMTYCFDAGKTFPWPVYKKYDIFVGLQVLEHLEDKGQAFKEIERISDVAVVSLPYKWNCPGDVHHMIDENTVKSWAEKDPAVSYVIAGRLVNLYKFKVNTQ